MSRFSEKQKIATLTRQLAIANAELLKNDRTLTKLRRHIVSQKEKLDALRGLLSDSHYAQAADQILSPSKSQNPTYTSDPTDINWS